MGQREYLLAVKKGSRGRVYTFRSKHDRAMFLHELTKGGKQKVEYAFSER